MSTGPAHNGGLLVLVLVILNDVLALAVVSVWYAAQQLIMHYSDFELQNEKV